MNDRSLTIPNEDSFCDENQDDIVHAGITDKLPFGNFNTSFIDEILTKGEDTAAASA